MTDKEKELAKELYDAMLKFRRKRGLKFVIGGFFYFLATYFLFDSSPDLQELLYWIGGMVGLYGLFLMFGGPFAIRHTFWLMRKDIDQIKKGGNSE